MRGKVHDRAEEFSDPGITPAYAGKSPTQSLKAPSSSGSPPPMRGKGPVLYASILWCGITPAYAGKSLWTPHPVL